MDSYNIHTLSTIITRAIRLETIRYILGARGARRQLLRDYPQTRLWWINYVFILVDDNKALRAWLLSNPVLEDPLNLLIYYLRPNNISRQPTPWLRGHNYLVPGTQTNGANEAIAGHQLCGGSFDPGDRPAQPIDNPGPANQASKLQDGDVSKTLLVALSGASWDVSGARDGRKGSVGMSSSARGETRESPAKRIPLALNWSGRLNIEDSAGLGHHPTQGDMTPNHRALFYDKTCNERKSKRLRLASMARQFLET